MEEKNKGYYLSNYIHRVKVEHDEKWMALQEAIPFLEFPAGWRVRVVPPFAGALARFHVDASHLGMGDEVISVYLDWWDRLGCMGQPYWEAYPLGGDTQRFQLNETKELVAAIAQELERREKLLKGNVACELKEEKPE